MTEWQPIETAPKDRDILVWFDHDADPYFEQNDSHRLTDYAANAEACGYLQGRGYAIAKWMPPEFEATDEYGSGFEIPAGWFSRGDYGDYENACNALRWTPLLDASTL